MLKISKICHSKPSIRKGEKLLKPKQGKSIIFPEQFFIQQKNQIAKTIRMNNLTSRSKLINQTPSQQSNSTNGKTKKLIKRQLSICSSTVQKNMQVYRWRSQTQFPIVKIKNVELVASNQEPKYNPQTIMIEVALQSLVYSLADLGEISLFRMLYLLKETLIGLERLFSKFGAFLLTEKMIFIDQSGKCKVWLSSKIQQNDFIQTKFKQPQFLSHVFQIFKAKTIQTKQSSLFYQNIKVSCSFFSALEFIEGFVEKQKIKVPSYFRLSQFSNTSTSLEKRQRKNDMNLTMSKKPIFLTNLELTSNRQQELEKSKKSIANSEKFVAKHPSKMEMKISGDTAPESEKNIMSSNQKGEQSPSLNQFKKLRKQKQGKIWNSGKEQRQKRFTWVRKLSSNVNNQIPPTILVHPPKNHKGSENDFIESIAESMTFCDDLNFKNSPVSSRSSSADNQQKLIQKKNLVFSVNGWQLKVNSLFNDKQDLKKSVCKKDPNRKIPQKPPVKLQLLDKCTTNMCESFMEDHH